MIAERRKEEKQKGGKEGTTAEGKEERRKDGAKERTKK